MFKILFTDTTLMNPIRKFLYNLHLLGTLPFLAKNLSSEESECDVSGKYFEKRGKAYSFLVEKEDEVDYRGNMSIVSKTGKWYTQMFNVYPSPCSSVVSLSSGIRRNTGRIASLPLRHFLYI